MTTNLQQAANSLALHLFKSTRSDLGRVGHKMASTSTPSILTVHVYAPQTSWTGPMPMTWSPSKFKVEWLFDMGLQMQAAAQAVKRDLTRAKHPLPPTPSATTPKPVVKTVIKAAAPTAPKVSK